MLFRLLHLLQHEHTHSIADLADALDTTPQLVEVMLEDLERMGYLRRIGVSCAEHCGACELGGSCARTKSGRIWALASRTP